MKKETQKQIYQGLPLAKSPTKIVLFKNKQVRKTLHNNEWWFSVVDIVEALTESADPHDYWYRMKIRVKNEENTELSTMCRRLKLPSSDGKKYETDCVNTEDAFRIVQSIPSPKAEPFKRWLPEKRGSTSLQFERGRTSLLKAHVLPSMRLQINRWGCSFYADVCTSSQQRESWEVLSLTPIERPLHTVS